MLVPLFCLLISCIALRITDLLSQIGLYQGLGRGMVAEMAKIIATLPVPGKHIHCCLPQCQRDRSPGLVIGYHSAPKGTFTLLVVALIFRHSNIGRSE